MYDKFDLKMLIKKVKLESYNNTTLFYSTT